MDRLPATIARNRRVTAVSNEIQVELFRKSIHLLIAVVPFLASIHVGVTVAILAGGIVFYSYAESLRLAGHPVYIISALTVVSSRQRDLGHFVLGPVTLGLGAMISLLLYPEPAASIAIFALAFGDGFSSLVGKLLGGVRIPFSGGKTIAGSSACFVAVFIASYAILDNTTAAVLIAMSATALEALPSKDLDNIVLPVGTGFVATQIVRFFL